jgi:metal-responsive CopG/Arc/MetJ family transcriptional regulator
MSHVKTAISIDIDVFKAIDSLAKKAHLSRSRLFEMATREWVKKEKQKDLTLQINRAVEKDHVSPDETYRAESMRRHQRKLVKGEW